MIDVVNKKGRRIHPDKKVFLYQGAELVPNFDEN
jgi:hypothetical protein